MHNPPITSNEAAQRKYGRNEGIYRAAKYNPSRCAWEVSEPPYYIHSHQCERKPGHGPDKLYCKQHTKKVQEQTSG